MTKQHEIFATLSALTYLSLLACSSSGDEKRDSAIPDSGIETARTDTLPPPPVPDSLPPLDQAPVPDSPLPPPDSAPLDTAPVESEAGPPPQDVAIVEPPSPIDGGIALDGNAAVDVARSSVQRIADPQVPQGDTETLAADNAAFAFAAYQKLIGTADNIVFSPASISIALAMTYAGAAGTTATEMAQALHFNLPQARLHPAFNALDQALASRGEGQLGADGEPMRVRIVNSLWAEQSYFFRAEFLDLLAANYGAAVNLLDFINAPEPSRQTINAWVAEQTEDKIQELLPEDSIDEATRLVLTNAVYLNARWKTIFDSALDASFTLLDNSRVTVKQMETESLKVPAVQSASFKAVSLPYADERLSLLLVVPEMGQFAQVEASLDADGLDRIVSSMTTKRVALSMPRFRIETTTKLVEVLKQLGMKAAFSAAEADFSGMDGSRSLHIGGAFHKAFINVGEKGTEAAAASAVVMKDASMPMVDLFVSISSPFLYFLRDEPTGAILFMGRVLDPSKS